MKTLVLGFILVAGIFDSCGGKSCTLPSGYAGNTVIVPGGPEGGTPLQTSGNGKVIVDGFDCSEIKVYGGDGNPLPTYNVD